MLHKLGKAPYQISIGFLGSRWLAGHWIHTKFF